MPSGHIHEAAVGEGAINYFDDTAHIKPHRQQGINLDLSLVQMMDSPLA